MNTIPRVGFRVIATGAFALATGLASAADLQQIEDRLDIEQVCSHYAQALDTADPDAYAALFTKDAYLEVDGKAFRGQAEIRKLVQDIRKSLDIDKLPSDVHGRKYGPIRHILSGVVLDVKGNKATSQSYWTEVITNGKDAQGVGKTPSLLKMGRYDDEFIKQKGRWLFSRRIITGDLSMERPANFDSPFKN